jgi:hypothetical protein
MHCTLYIVHCTVFNGFLDGVASSSSTSSSSSCCCSSSCTVYSFEVVTIDSSFEQVSTLQKKSHCFGRFSF